MRRVIIPLDLATMSDFAFETMDSDVGRTEAFVSVSSLGFARGAFRRCFLLFFDVSGGGRAFQGTSRPENRAVTGYNDLIHLA